MTPTQKGVVLTLLASTGAAVFLSVFKLGTEYGSLQHAVLFLLGSAAAFNTVASIVSTRSLAVIRLDRKSFAISVVFALLTLGGNLCATLALQRISAPLTSVFQQTQVVLVAYLGARWLGETLTSRFWIGGLLAGFGLVLLRLDAARISEFNAAGTTYATLSALCFALMAVITKRYIHEIQPIAVNAVRLWMAVLIWVLYHGLPQLAELRWQLIACCGVAAFLGPFLARIALMYSLRYIPASLTTLLGLITPALALIPAFIVFGMLPTSRELLGSIVMIAGIALPTLGALRDSPTAAPV
ncbi:MAG: DMT family transporter [Polyangiaceae bacterium]|nr:DMT family transporter [Polyangiaceae bacterium]